MPPKSLALLRQQESAGAMEVPRPPGLCCITPIPPFALGSLAFHSSSLQELFLFLLFIRFLNGSFSGAQATAELCSEALGSNYLDPCSQSKKESLAAIQFVLEGCWHKLRIASSCCEPPAAIKTQGRWTSLPLLSCRFRTSFHAALHHCSALCFCLHRSFSPEVHLHQPWKDEKCL